MIRNLLAGLLALLVVPWAQAFEPFVVQDIRVEGIQRTEAGTVFSYLPVKVGDQMDDEKAAQSIRALFATGFFKDVRVEVDNGVLVVIVDERPAIARIDFEGLKEFDKDQLIKGLKETGFGISQVFDRAMLEKAEQELKRMYLTRGMYAVEIQTTVTPLERNRIAVNFQVTEGNVAKIRQINLVGVKSFKEKDLINELELQTPNWISWYTKNDQYSKQKLSADLETIRSYYLNRGFLEFAIESTQVSISPDKKDIFITVNLSEGERFVVSSLKLAGNLILPEEEFRKAVIIKPGDVFSREKLNESTKLISEKLSELGYAFANVNASPELDKEKKHVAFTIFVDPGRRVYVRRINIAGNTKTRDEVIRREMRQMEGAWYNDERVKLSKSRIDKTDYFSEVSIETPPVPGTTDQVDVNIAVTEKNTGNISIGGGFSQSEKIVLSGSVEQANIFGSGKFASVQLNTGKINRAIGFSYTDPYFTVDGVSQGFDIYTRKSTPESLGYRYSTESIGGGIRFGIPIAETQSLNFGAAIDQTKVSIDRTDPETPSQYIRFSDRFCGGSEDCSTYSVPLTAGWVSNTKDSAINPTKGVYQRAGAEVSPVGDLKYYKLSYQRQHYYSVTRDWVLMLNGEVGYAKGLGSQELPFYKNLYAGGVNSVRGFDTASLGPYEVHNGEVVRLGGTQRVVFNAEATSPMPGFGKDKSLRFGPFFDVGLVRDKKNNDPGVYDGGSARMSVGLTAVWISFLGPLKFSIAQPINKKENDEVQRFQFQMGTVF